MTTVTSNPNGQITLPKEFRDQFKTNTYRVEVQNNICILVPVQKKKISDEREKMKFSLKDIEQGIFSSNTPTERNIVSKIDTIISQS